MAPPVSPRRRMRPGAWFLLLPLLILVGLALAEAFGWPFLRGPLEARLGRQLEREVRIAEPFRLHLLGSVRLEAGGLWIAAPEGFERPHFVDAQGLAMKLRYRDLLALRERPGLRIADMKVERLDAQLLRHADGQSTWQSPRQAEEAEARGEPSPPPQVDHLLVGAGQVVLRDAKSGADLTTHFETREGVEAAEAETHLATTGRYAGKPLRGELRTRGLLPLAGGEASLPAKGWLQYGGVRLEFEGTVSEIYDQRRIKGAVVVSGPSLAVLGELVGSVLPTSPPFRLKGDVDNEGGVWHANVADARIGSSRLAGHFAFEPDARPRPRLSGELRGQRLALVDLGPAFGTRSPEGKPVAPPPGRTLPDRPLDLPSLKNMDAAVAVNLAQLDLGEAFAQPITPFQGRISLEDGRLALTHVNATTARGSLAGSVAVEADREHWQADLAWRGIRLEDWIKVSRSRSLRASAAPSQAASGRETSAPAETGGNSGAGQSAPPPYFTGQLQGRAKLTGRGRSTAELLGSLEGEGTTFVRGGSMSHLVVEALGLDVAQGLGLILKGDEDVPLECAVIDFQAHEGRIVPRVAVLDTPVTLVQIDGSADLAKEALDLRLVAKPRNVSPLTLRSPLRVKGSFADPQVSAEKGPIAARVAGGLLLGIVSPVAAILPFLDPGESAESPCAATMARLEAKPAPRRPA
jgi:AsmA family protein